MQAIHQQNATPVERPARDKPFAATKTGPGGLSAAMMEVDERVIQLTSRAEEAEKALGNWQGAAPAKKMDPKTIGHSSYANRLNESFSGAEFDALKKEIQEAGGNVQPIKVRPVTGKTEQFEVVFGHRRHRACLELGVDVLAVIEVMDDRRLFTEMDRENRLRADLKPYEQGLMYKRALDSGLYPSQRKLAEDLGVDQGNVSKAVALASLPTEVLCAFSSPLAIQYRWVSPLKAAYDKDGEGVVEAAKEVVSRERRPSDESVFVILSGKASAPGRAREASAQNIVGKNGVTATLRSTSSAHIFEIPKSGLTPGKVDQIRDLIEQLLG
ncbi:ParB/RepB/Spo0J family partition protein [Hydrogenophaga laconesensis]|uniref:ParB family chromosome partitioning protein n=1 Tax=Hydrogenophaga laconesensis TaxID=1805971 RepID=A0ABU1VJ25_9BURK|nr:ParB/RepB/Spo0J family partition protein [Hydrogenophaga laconesensis]MDR7097491.1 ParB family chromosome partitioning protein [Hydrogenophaga laconesensis]